MISIRPMTINDVWVVVIARNESRKLLNKPKEISYLDGITFFNSFVVTNKQQIFIIENDLRSIGYLNAVDLGDGDCEVGIKLIGLYRGKGYGKEALMLFRETLKARGVKKLVAEIKKNNEASIGLFGKCGFKKKLEYEEAIIMEKKL